MTTAKICVEKCIQDVDNALYHDEPGLMYSQIFFSLHVGDQTFEDLSVDLRQPYGSDYLHEAVQVSTIRGYDGPIDRERFKSGIAKYYRSVMQERGSITSLGAEVLRTRNNTYNFKDEFEVELGEYNH